MSYSVLVFGCGSIGQRHARIAASLGASITCISSRTNLPWPTVRELSALPQTAYDLVIIATPTALHTKHLQDILSISALHGAMLLVEKPIAANMEKTLLHLGKQEMKRIVIGYNLRFHPGIQRLRELIVNRQLVYLQLDVGQYLPTWRPSTDYSKSYSANAEDGGGALRDLSHELDLAGLLAGKWQAVTAIGGKCSNLTISSDDSYTLLAKHERCPQVTIHVDYLQRPARRQILAVWENGSAHLNLISGELTTDNQLETFATDSDTTYIAQLQAIINGQYSHLCDFNAGMDALSYVCAAEGAAREGKWQCRQI